ncbi:ABC transporter permease subunit [Georgenia thermotolerans]|uniref:ABC transporter permease subunit n=1 Tax=Georgenia thermotolerans TaxID=527326 RepID=A0A7J5URJ6_9MICO|nr:ABC transporter permease subunit [Georgenia thermotolerans]KAE8764754.1 ABC transporter permease subunit [Georgenia thermotolerans]
MSTATAAPATRGRAAAPAPVHARLTFPGVMRGEWIKLLSLRSTWWTLGITVALMALIGLAGAASLGMMAEDPQGAGMLETMHGAELATSGYQFGMVTVAVLGALLITGEYSTGMIRSTLAAVPARLPVLAAKAIALTVLTVVVSVVGLALSFLVTAPFLADYDLVPALDDSQTWQVFGGTVFFLVASSLFALGVGTLLRSTAGAITGSLVILFLLPVILQFIQIDWVQDIVSFLPMPAANGFLSVSDTFGSNDLLSPWQAVAVVAAYPVVTLAAAAVVLRRRDA